MALSPDILQEYFKQAQKCKISWKIEKIEISNQGQCSTEMIIFIKWENNDTHFMNATVSNKECILDSYYKIFFENDLNIWTKVEYILDTKNYHALGNNLENTNTDNIPFCTENKIEISQNNYNFEVFSWMILFSVIICIFAFKLFHKIIKKASNDAFFILEYNFPLDGLKHFLSEYFVLFFWFLVR